MRIEFEDIAENKRAYGCAQAPPGVTLGQIFDHDANLKKIEKTILQVSVNGNRIDNWREVAPVKSDAVKFTVGPSDFVSAFLSAIIFGVPAAGAGGGALVGGLLSGIGFSGIFGIISTVSFFIDLFNRPQSPKIRSGPRESPTYGFAGLQDTMVPGNPIPVTYGTHRQGGQVLMFYLEVGSGSEGRRLIMNEQLGLCHGPVASITAVEINGVPAIDISSTVTIQTRLGGTSQSVMDGFDRIRNSFADGREISSEGIIYQSVGNAIESVDLIISAPALFSPNDTGDLKKQTVGYSLERRASGATAWTLVQSDQNRVVAKTTQQIYFQHTYQMPSRGGYDFQLKHVFHDHMKNKFAAQEIYLHAVTEYQDVTGPHSGIAQIGIRAVATSQLQGGRPNITALVGGKLVRVYTSTTSFSTNQTGNPAWCPFDYMTNSVYGKAIPIADMDVQSFLDFATLSDSLAQICA